MIGLDVWLIGDTNGENVRAMASIKIGDRRYKGSVDIETDKLKTSQAAKLTEALLHDIRNELIGDIKQEFCSINKQLK